MCEESRVGVHAQYNNNYYPHMIAEGYGGYKRGTFKEKDWLLSVAKKVKLNAAKYERQLKNCEIAVKKRNWNIFD